MDAAGPRAERAWAWGLACLLAGAGLSGCARPDPNWTTIPAPEREPQREPQPEPQRPREPPPVPASTLAEHESMGIALQVDPTEPRVGAFGWYWRLRIEPSSGERAGAGFEFGVGPSVAWGRLRNDLTDRTRSVAWASAVAEPAFALRFGRRWYLRVGASVNLMFRRPPPVLTAAATMGLATFIQQRRVELTVHYQPVFETRAHSPDSAWDAIGHAWLIGIRIDHSAPD